MDSWEWKKKTETLAENASFLSAKKWGGGGRNTFLFNVILFEREIVSLPSGLSFGDKNIVYLSVCTYLGASRAFRYQRIDDRQTHKTTDRVYLQRDRK